MLLCLQTSSHAPRGDTAPDEALYQYAQYFLTACALCVVFSPSLRSAAKCKNTPHVLSEIWIISLFHLDTFGCFYAPVGARTDMSGALSEDNSSHG